VSISLTHKEEIMSNRLATPDDIFREGKRLLAKAGNDLDLLELAVQKMDAALLERARAIYPSLDVGPKQLFDRLQTDHIIDAAGRTQISWGHRVRNMSAHAKAHSLTYAHIERYAEVVKTILGKTGSRKRTAPKPKQHTSDRPRDKSQRPINTRPSSPPTEWAQTADPSLTEPSDVAEPIYLEEPDELPEPALSELSMSYDDDLPEPLEIEVGGSEPTRPTAEPVPPPADSSLTTEDDGELLRRLLGI
jgi:hypothetical protein